MTTNKLNNRNWEPWQLTAYVLGELSPDLSAQIERESADEPRLAEEISAIRKTIDQVTAVFAAEPSDKLATGNIDRVFANADQAAATQSNTHATKSVARSSNPRRPYQWLGLLAMASCLLLAVWLSVPGVSNWFLASISSVDTKNAGTREVALDPSIAGTEPLGGESMTLERGAGVLGSGAEVALDAPVEKTGQESFLGFDAASSAPASGSNLVAPGRAIEIQSNFGKSTDGTGRMGSSGVMGGGGYPGAGGRPEFSGFVGEAGASITARVSAGVESRMMTVPPRIGIQSDEEAKYDDPSRWTNPGSTDRYHQIVENPFEQTIKSPLSTFSIDVDTASYAKVRQLLFEGNQLPPRNAVRIEEFINYFDYEYPQAEGTGKPFAVDLAVASCPWRPEHRLVRIAMQAARADMKERARANIVFLLDVSGSMNAPNRLPLVKESMRMLIEQLGENDKVAIVVYAGAAGCVLESTPGNQQATILSALDRLQAGGSTNGGDGIQLAYNLARNNFIEGGINRVILCTDGDFNVGVTGDEALVNLVVENSKSKIFLTVLGFGMGNTNDSMMEQISGRGNGVYGFVDTWREAKRQMVQQVTGNLITVAKDVKLQVEFNPQHVHAYRLLGYENRILAAEDFNNDAKDAGDIGAGHRVTALYEIVPVGSESNQTLPLVDDLRYQPKRESVAADNKTEAVKHEAGQLNEELRRELLAVKIRYKEPEGSESKLLVFPLEEDRERAFAETDNDFRWSVSVAEFAMLLRGSQYSGNASWSQLIEQARSAAGNSPSDLQEECLQMIERAAQLSR